MKYCSNLPSLDFPLFFILCRVLTPSSTQIVFENIFPAALGNKEQTKQYAASVAKLYSYFGYSLYQDELKLCCFTLSILLLIGYFISFGWCGSMNFPRKKS